MVELYNLLQTLNLPLAYHHFSSPQIPPYIVYLNRGTENFSADNRVYQKQTIFHVELYSAKKDLATEKRIEDLFDENDIIYDTNEVYIKEEALYQVVYELTI